MDTPFLGQIELFPYNFAPMGWQLCDGSVFQVIQNQALFSLIGFKFGGNGSTTFAVPDLRNAVPLEGTAYYIAMEGYYPVKD